jgi:hypothetical protein
MDVLNHPYGIQRRILEEKVAKEHEGSLLSVVTEMGGGKEKNRTVKKRNATMVKTLCVISYVNKRRTPRPHEADISFSRLESY